MVLVDMNGTGCGQRLTSRLTSRWCSFEGVAWAENVNFGSRQH